VESEYLIQDGGRPGAEIPNISDEYKIYTEIRVADISATISRRRRTTETAPSGAGRH
jgi:hypothetical protein